jgi:hypothetical protein
VLSEYESEVIDDFDRPFACRVRSILVTALTGSARTVVASPFGASAGWTAHLGAPWPRDSNKRRAGDRRPSQRGVNHLAGLLGVREVAS